MLQNNVRLPSQATIFSLQALRAFSYGFGSVLLGATLARDGDSPLAVVARNPDHIDLFWIAPDNNIHTAWWDAGFEGWHPYAIEGTQVGDIRFQEGTKAGDIRFHPPPP